MYQPKHFEQTDRAQIAALLRAHPLATLVHQSSTGLTADAVPLLFDVDEGAHGALRGHVARANPLWRDADGRDVLAIFNGPQGYVTPSWYPSKREHGKVVPTWNYAVVHAHGRLRAVDDARWLRAFVERLTTTHEGGRAAPWAVHDAPTDYIESMLRAIVGFEIALTRVEAKWKVSQNRAASDRDGVAAGLDAEGHAAMATLVRGGPT